MAENETVARVARLMSAMFTGDTRDNGDTFYKVMDGPWHDAMQEVVYKAHGDMFPDDYKYQFCVDALNAIADCDGDVESARDGLEPDVYNGRLLQWLASNLTRASYTTEAAREFGMATDGDGDFDLYRMIAQGQWMEMREVFDVMAEAVAEQADEEEAKADARGEMPDSVFDAFSAWCDDNAIGEELRGAMIDCYNDSDDDARADIAVLGFQHLHDLVK